MGLVLIASVYIGFVVDHGRPAVITVESSVVAIFLVVAAGGRGSDTRATRAVRPG